MIYQRYQGKCSIWPDFDAERGSTTEGEGPTSWVESSRTGGQYIIPLDVEEDLGPELRARPDADAVRARLTTWLIDQRLLGNESPRITWEIVEYAKSKTPLPIYERAERLLRYAVSCSDKVGSVLDIDEILPEYLAWSESSEEDEVRFFLDYLIEKNWLKRLRSKRLVGPGSVVIGAEVTVEGFNRVAELAANADSSQAFVAMWFDDSVTDLYDKGIAPAVRAAGYEPVRIDRVEGVIKINDAIIAEIQRSRFIVADFTHGKEGARGGVYYEAGFAEGRGIPVIWTCREDMMDKIHFDTRDYYHIPWDENDASYADFQRALKNRILHLIGEGPHPINSQAVRNDALSGAGRHCYGGGDGDKVRHRQAAGVGGGAGA